VKQENQLRQNKIGTVKVEKDFSCTDFIFVYYDQLMMDASGVVV